MESAKAMASYTTFFGGERVAGSKENNAENKLIYSLYLEQQLKNKISQAQEVTCHIFRVISRIDNPVVRSVMEARYIQGLKPYEIADKCGYNVRWVYKLLNKGEKTAEEIINRTDYFPPKSNYM